MKEFIVVTVKELKKLFKTWSTYTDAYTTVFLEGLILTSSFVPGSQDPIIWIPGCKLLFKQVALAHMSMSSEPIALLM